MHRRWLFLKLMFFCYFNALSSYFAIIFSTWIYINFVIHVHCTCSKYWNGYQSCVWLWNRFEQKFHKFALCFSANELLNNSIVYQFDHEFIVSSMSFVSLVQIVDKWTWCNHLTQFNPWKIIFKQHRTWHEHFQISILFTILNCTVSLGWFYTILHRLLPISVWFRFCIRFPVIYPMYRLNTIIFVGNS